MRASVFRSATTPMASTNVRAAQMMPVTVITVEKGPPRVMYRYRAGTNVSSAKPTMTASDTVTGGSSRYR